MHEFEFAPDPFVQTWIACADDLLRQCSANGWESAYVDSAISQPERLIRYAAKNRSLD